jgi:hypothetical protein
MTTIIIPSLELAPVGNEAAPSILLFSLVVDDMGTGESLKMKQYEHTQMSLSPFEGVDSGKTVKQVANDGF